MQKIRFEYYSLNGLCWDRFDCSGRKQWCAQASVYFFLSFFGPHSNIVSKRSFKNCQHTLFLFRNVHGKSLSNRGLINGSDKTGY